MFSYWPIFSPVRPRISPGQSELGPVSFSFQKWRIVQPSFQSLIYAVICSLRGKRSKWKGKAILDANRSARGSRAVSRSNSLSFPFRTSVRPESTLYTAGQVENVGN